MSTYNSFIFKDYSFDEITGTATFTYAIDDVWDFTETYTFGVSETTYNTDALDKALQLLFFIAGVSYYKTFLPPTIVVKKGSIDTALAEFLGITYQKGLAEFFYQNKLDVHTNIRFPVTVDAIDSTAVTAEPTMLIAIGGGKDSLVSYELAKRADQHVRTWSLGHAEQIRPLVERMKSENHVFVEREIDQQLFTIDKQGAFNGHIPISAIFAAASTVLCILTNSSDSVMSNEQSANEPTLFVDGEPVNHQYSKSQEFEHDYQAQLARMFKGSLRYYSLLRPYSEAKITKLFSELCFDRYKDVFSSCNRAYVQSSTAMSWCGECPKCAFTFLALSAFLPKKDVEKIWDGKNLLLDAALQHTYRQLLGITDDGKPFECVGEIKECRTLFDLVALRYPEFYGIYEYDIPEDYYWDDFMPHSIPDEISKMLPT